jgi:CheY-like chemotaxis protein
MPNRVLIADDDTGLMKVLARRCRRMGLTVEEARDGFEAGLGLFVAADPTDLPRFIILDVNMPIDDGLSLCEELARDEDLAQVPVIVLTGRNDRGTIQRCRELGAHYVHKSGNVWEKLEPLIDKLLEAEASTVASVPAPAPRSIARRSPAVLIVEDDHLLSAVIQKRLRSYGLLVERAFTAGEGYWKAVNELPDLIITDHVMPDAYGSYLLHRLREHPLTANIPVIVLTGCDMSGMPSNQFDPSLERCFLNLGAECVLRKPIDYEALLALMRRHIEFAEDYDRSETAACS